MDIEERCDKVVSLQSQIFKLIKESSASERLYEQKLIELKKNFDLKKSHYTTEIRKSDRYNLEYVFLLEQYNLNRLSLESKIKKSMMYTERLTKFSEHLRTRKVQRLVDIKRTFFEFNDIVQKELISAYESDIQILKQRKILSDSFERYLVCLKEKYQSDYEQKKDFSISKEELDEINEKKDMLKEEQRIVIKELSERFKISDDVIVSMQLSNPNVMIVAQTMYPNLKEKMLELNESRNVQFNNRKAQVVQFNSKENDDNIGIRAM